MINIEILEFITAAPGCVSKIPSLSGEALACEIASFLILSEPYNNIIFSDMECGS